MKEERLRWVLPIVKKEIRLVDLARVCPYGKRSLERWVREYRECGEKALEPKSTRPKTSPRETPIHIKESVIERRRETKQCAKKLAWDFEEIGVQLHERTIGKFLKQEGLTRRYRTRKLTWKYIKVPLRAGALIEIDVKYVPNLIASKRFFQFTAIDVASRWRYLEAFDEQTRNYAVTFFEQVIARFPYRITAVKTDNHAIFTTRYTGSYRRVMPNLHNLFDDFCEENNITHYLIDPGKPAQNGTVERSHRTDQEQFYDGVSFRNFSELQYKLRLWNMKYNDTKHCGLNGKTPNEALLLV